MPRRAVHKRASTAALPQWVRPQLTELVDAAPEGEAWLHDIKFDGAWHRSLYPGCYKVSSAHLEFSRRNSRVWRAVPVLGAALATDGPCA
jgi:hypothetical protein